MKTLKMIYDWLIEVLLTLLKKEQVEVKDPIVNISPTQDAAIRDVKHIKPTIVENLLPSSQYVNEVTEKDFIVLHHTVGGDSTSTYAYWLGNKERVATHFLIDRDGTIIQCVPLDNWAYHIYISSPGNQIPKEFRKLGSQYDKRSIGIELCNLGQVTLKNGVFYDIYKRAISADKVVTVPKYKGYEYWEGYTPAQIKSLESLLIDLLERFPKIKSKLKDVNYRTFTQVQQSALNMNEAIVFHTTLRVDKFDLYPNDQIINMLNNLYSKVKVK